MDASTLSSILPVAAILLVGAILLWATLRKPGATNAALALQAAEERIAALQKENVELGKRLVVEEQKALRVQEVEITLANREREISSLRDSKEQIAVELATKDEALRRQTDAAFELQKRLQELESEFADASAKLSASTSTVARLSEEIRSSAEKVAERDESLKTANAQLEKANGDLKAERDALADLRVAHATLEKSLDAERELAVEKIATLTEARDQLTNEFKLLSGEIFKKHSEDLTVQNKEQLQTLLNPMREKIVEFQQGLQIAQTEAAKEQATLKEQIRTLSEASTRMTDETGNLTRALKGKAQTQGAWGEMILATILEKSGLRKDQEYRVQQHTVSDEGARLRPDVIVDLPNGLHVVVDSKVSLTAFEQAINAESPEERAAAMDRHLISIKSHIKLLGGKEYHRAIGSELDYVVLFVPIEGALAAALEIEPDLTLIATELNVAIATPTTLMMALRTVSGMWQVERRNRNAEDIANRAGLLYDKVYGLVQDLSTVDSSLNAARKNFDQAMRKLSTGNGNLIWQVETMKKLGAKTQKSLPTEMVERAEVEQELLMPLEQIPAIAAPTETDEP